MSSPNHTVVLKSGDGSVAHRYPLPDGPISKEHVLREGVVYGYVGTAEGEVIFSPAQDREAAR